MALTLEFGEQIDVRWCESCGTEIRSGDGDVYEDDEFVAAYWFDVHEHVTDRRARLLVMMRDLEATSTRKANPLSVVVHRAGLARGRRPPSGLQDPGAETRPS